MATYVEHAGKLHRVLRVAWNLLCFAGGFRHPTATNGHGSRSHFVCRLHPGNLHGATHRLAHSRGSSSWQCIGWIPTNFYDSHSTMFLRSFIGFCPQLGWGKKGHHNSRLNLDYADKRIGDTPVCRAVKRCIAAVNSCIASSIRCDCCSRVRFSAKRSCNCNN